MNNDRGFAEERSELRRRAEECLKKSGVVPDVPISPAEFQRVVHELSVHQIELEMQQDELVCSRIGLEESLGKYTQLYDFAPVGYLTLGRESKIRQANLTATKLLGVDRSRLLCMHFKQFVLPEDYRIVDALLETVFSKKVPGNCEVRLLASVSQPATDHSDHSLRIVRIDAAISDPFDVCRIILFDITERKQAEQLLVEGRVKLEAALTSMGDAVFISDTTGDFIHYNDAFATFHKFRNKDECPKTLDEYPKFLEVYLITGELVPLEDWAVPRALRGETAKGVEFRLLRKDTGQTWFGSYNYAPIRNNNGLIVGSVVTGRDISERKAAEQKIKGYVTQLENAMRSTLQAVANVVEAHDPYTAGHERRVGMISAAIAREMGWSEEKCNTLQLIGLVHDIGKISIPAEILSKPGLLSAIEFELVKTHAEHGYEILQDIEFPLPIARIIREHHERMDGSGYPQGLKGEATLLEARILAVADVLESMASHRPYRPSLGIEEALHEIERHRVQQFDPEVVDAMLRLFREKGYQIPV